MRVRRNAVLAVMAAGATLLAVPGHALAARVILPKPGEIGFAGLAQFGTLFKGGEIGEDFRSGGGMAVRLRYRMRYERGLGLSFERHGFEPRVTSTVATAPQNSTLIAAGAEIYQMFGTRTRTVRMLSAGIGLAQITQKLNDGETQVSGRGVGDAFYIGLGGEIEYFFWNSWAVDVSVRHHVIILHQSTNNDLQFSVGLVFYASS